MKSTVKAILYVTLITAIALVPITSVFAQVVPGGTTSSSDTPYTLEQITHAFEIMEEYTTFDENKIITFDTAAATRDNVSELDIRIALDFIAHSNDMMATLVAGPTGTVNELDSNTELHREIDEFREGKFQNLFATGGTGPVGQTMKYSDVTHGPVIPLTGESGIYVDGRPQSAYHHPRACGDYGFNKHHPFIRTGDQYFPSEMAAKAHGILNGYHRVPIYATGAYGYDYAHVADVGADYGNCDDGEFRHQVSIRPQPNDEWRRLIEGPEPNPEVLAYFWPAIWWGPYVVVWHDAN